MALIRRAAAADLDAVLAIEGSWKTTPHWSRRQFEAELKSPRSIFVVAEADLAVLAYAAAWVVVDEAQVLSVAVHPGALRRGLARKTLNGLLDEALKSGCRKATLEVSETNEGARRLYESMGFAAVGKRPGFYPDGTAAILMDKVL
ncbi:MAG TPA: ribosomal-protein-alanine N-acetyltransferase [Elusimicrobia bacterium]|nr:ribosomal-protein-alanine N-acetyltransferase [Elusimicrobiota bacterium]